ncbi:alpha/beta hydrolase [Saccharomonospora cyanea]|uniref:Chlorophyllase n=1 Tax=Saccharomonospora cyanea NA-134 TaxID=882082 RepID=H5XGR1_9PSEU|nr:alpha/beta hydrolase [Saccharomonospora cyanea]EHR61604.1 hypothetical protein SaccyDRAFT_2758 [Saccharomonospora cyanea NA-134]
MSTELGEKESDDGTGSAPARRRRFGRVARGARPHWRGATSALLALTAALVAWNTADQLVPGVGGELAGQLAVNGVLAVAIAAVVTGLLFVTVGRRAALPWTYTATLLMSLVLLLTLGAGATRTGYFAAVGILVVGVSLLGGAVGGLLPHRGRRPLRSRDPRVIAFALAVLVVGGPAGWLVTAGQKPVTVVDDGEATHTLGRNPAAAGPHSVAELTYGSGHDRRPEYGADADLTTDSVDVSALVTGWNEDRHDLWGFDADAFPVNARVWYPQGDGPFPLVLLVHGNKSNATSSEDGFRYLGEQLASHGVIAASVDQNFLNTGVLDRSGGLRGVEQVRARMLRHHLTVWKAWTEQDGNPFTGKVDLDAVGLLGHSRGGEAVAAAAELLQNERVDGLRVRSVLALAPSDGQSTPDGQAVTLRDVNYLVLQGSHDADVVSFGGLNQYERVEFTGAEYRFAASLYIERANHGQFNSRWDRHDVGYGLPKLFLDDDALLPGEQQRRIAKLYATAYFTGTLGGETADLALFRDHRAAASWLPDTNYVSRFTDSTAVVADEESVRIDGAEEAVLSPLPLRSGPGEDVMHHVEWAAEQRPVVTAAAKARPGIDAVVFDAVATGESGTVTVRLTDATGEHAAVPLADVRPLHTAVPGQYLVAPWLHTLPVTEPVPQTHRVPVESMTRHNPAFSPEELTSVELVFDGEGGGSVFVGDIGVTGGRPA